MSSQSDSNSAKSKKPKSFEPTTTQDTSAKPKKTPASRVTAAPVRPSAPASPSAIPEAVSRRMIKRMAWLSGVPTLLAMATFLISYLLITKEIVDLPNYIVLILSLGFFGLGVLGLSYGVLSASWDEQQEGSWLGVDEFKVNWGRMTEAKAEAKAAAKTAAKTKK
jgi:hypothetical protein